MKDHRRTIIGGIASSIPFLVILLAVVALLLSTYVLPYQPFKVRDIEVKAKCAGGSASVYIERKFTDGLEKLELTESWVAVNVPGINNGVAVKSESGSIPEDKLTTPNSPGFVRVQSPLLTQAPPIPGVYRIKIETHAFGTRWAVFPTDYTETFRSDLVRVKACNGKEQGT